MPNYNEYDDQIQYGQIQQRDQFFDFDAYDRRGDNRNDYDRGYRQGYRQGYNQGYRQGQRECYYRPYPYNSYNY